MVNGLALLRGVPRHDERARDCFRDLFHVRRFDVGDIDLLHRLLCVEARSLVEGALPAAAEALAAQYVDGDRVPHATIVERYRSFPQVSFVYAVEE